MSDIDIEEKLTQEKKYQWIFTLPEIEGEIPVSRFDSIRKCIFADIQPFIDSIKKEMTEKSNRGDNSPCLSGILSIPKLVCCGLEIVSCHYTGITIEANKREYRAKDNVQKYISLYFPGLFKEIPIFFWDSVRNGMIHSHYPKYYTFDDKVIGFSFYIEDACIPSHFTENDGKYIVFINCFELFDVFKESVNKYRKDLEIDESLQDNFIKSYNSKDICLNLQNDMKDEINKLLKTKGDSGVIFLKNKIKYTSMLEFFNKSS